ncbi:MAG: Hsp70 family protein [Deltaproteobacteria bacterium]|nr:Hsp70 family protein [Deltaproteobacteria bacterium]
MTTKTDGIRQTFLAMRDGNAPASRELRGIVMGAVKQLSASPEFLDIYRLGLELINRIEDPVERRKAVLDYVKEVPGTEAFHQFCAQAMEAAIIAADAEEDQARRITDLVRLAGELPRTKGFLNLRILAWRLALNLPDKPRYKEPDLVKTGSQLPKPNDYTFYRRYTLMGVLKEMPRDAEFAPVYVEAIALALKAAAIVTEPYYRKVAFVYIAEELRERKDMRDAYAGALAGAYNASLALPDPFARELGLIDVLQMTPKSHEHLALIERLVTDALAFFTIRRWVEEIDPLDVVDSLLAAEDHGITDSKKRRFDREKFADMLSKELDKFGAQVNDPRLIETLRPYSHVWVQPSTLRDAVKRVMERLEALKDLYHGREVERPEFVAEKQTAGPEAGRYIHRKDAGAVDCIAIDLGATNTVIMRKRHGAEPAFLQLPGIGRDYEGCYSVPTILSAETNKIGAEVVEDFPIVNIKQMMLDANPQGRAYMERFLRILSQHMKKATLASGWLGLKASARGMADVVYVTVPVGYQQYRNAVRELAERAFKGVTVELIEEPLAAAVGYQVIERRDKVVMVVDFGGSTLNTMVARVNINEVHVVAKPDRAKILGGRDIDEWLAQHLARTSGIRADGAPYRLLLAAEETKIALSNAHEAAFIWEGREAGRITRPEFEEVLDKRDFYKLIDRTISYVLRKAQKVGVNTNDIESVLLTGGSSQIPSFKEKIGHLFPGLREKNQIYDHSPLTAVSHGAALYGTRDILDRHLGLAYAFRYATVDKVEPFSYGVVLEKGELLPLEKTFKVRPARKLGDQKGLAIEIFEVPDSMLQRVWVMEGGIEFLKQEFKQPQQTGKTAGAGQAQFIDIAPNPLKPFNIAFSEPVEEDVFLTLCVAETGALSVRCGTETIDTGLRLQ